MKTVTYDETKWQLVPVEPTEDMVVAGFESDAWDKLGDAVIDHGGWPYSCRESAACVTDTYKAMLSTAPTPPDHIADLSKMVFDIKVAYRAGFMEARREAREREQQLIDLSANQLLYELRAAVVALAHAAENDKTYRPAYERASSAIDAAMAAGDE